MIKQFIATQKGFRSLARELLFVACKTPVIKLMFSLSFLEQLKVLSKEE